MRFGHCELLGDIDSAGVLAFKAGDKVRVKRTVVTPKYVALCLGREGGGGDFIFLSLPSGISGGQ